MIMVYQYQIKNALNFIKTEKYVFYKVFNR